MLNFLAKIFGHNIQQINSVIGSGNKFGNIRGNMITQIGNGTVSVNGVTYSGKNITIRNGKVQIDGNDVTPADEKVITITVEGNVNKLQVDACESCTITGEVKSVSTMSGDVEINGNCSGDIDTMSGDVTVSGHCDGDIDSMSGKIRTGSK